jgi:cytochrome d ubiquinol oxidase subunit II
LGEEKEMINIFADGSWLPIVFAFLMGFSILLYVILDGYDLGVGMLLIGANNREKDLMIASIGPFWDANETWLVMGVGILLVAFPVAHGIILTALYLPTAVMLISLILRGVSFDFRAKVLAGHKHRWNKAFFAGSLFAALSQGYMLGMYIMSFEHTLSAHLFAVLTALSVASGYCFIGSAWLLMKTSDKLQIKAVKWARASLFLTTVGIGLISVATPVFNKNIFEKWFSFPNIILLAPIPLITLGIIFYLQFHLSRMPYKKDKLCWLPFAGGVVTFILCFLGLAYSFFPYIVPQKLTIFDAASAYESLIIIFVGAMFVLPCIVGYTIFAYRVFWGKVQDLRYY